MQPNPLEVALPLGAAGNILLFVANDDVHGPELWRTDGTASGTRLLADLTPGPSGTQFSRLHVAELDGRLVISPRVNNAPQLLVTDGSSVTTLPIQPTTGAALWYDMRRMGDYVALLSVPVQADTARQLFATDGTPAGTMPLPFALPAGDATGLASLGTSAVTFVLQSPGRLGQLYKLEYDGAFRLRLLGDAGVGAPVRSSMLSGGSLFFVGSDLRHGVELWVTPAGAVAEIEGLGCGSRPVQLSVTRPGLGTNLILRVDGLPSQVVMSLGMPQLLPVRFPIGGTMCLSHVSAPSVHVGLARLATSLVVPIPAANSLRGSILEARAIVGPTSNGIDLSNALRLRLDY